MALYYGAAVSEGGQIERRRIIYRWDLDKTYLRTEFDTVRDLVRTALETPGRKKTVPGASALLREIRASEPAGIYILSGSPEQMRRVLEAKLRLDGVQWDAFTLKPSLRNLMRGRFRFLRDQVSYKLASLLASRTRVDPDTDEVLFGDDAEADAFIYSLFADLCAGRVGNETLMAVLRRARVYEDDIPELVRMSGRLPQRDSVRRILIHLDRTSSPEVFADFGPRVFPFYNYFQAASLMLQDGLVEAESALRVGAELVVDHAFTADALAASFTDLVRRERVGRRAAERFVAAAAGIDRARYASAAPALRGFVAELEARAADLVDPEPAPTPVIDYVGLFSRDHARARAARKRAKWRAR